MKDQENSIIRLPIRLAKQDIEAILNQLVDGVLYEDKEMEGDGLMLRAEKSEAIEISFEENRLLYRVPLDIWVKKDFALTDVEAQGILALNFATAYEIRKDWQIDTKTELLQYEWLAKPNLKVAALDIPITYVVDKLIKRNKLKLGTTIDQKIKDQFELRNYIQQGWEVLSKPILISEEHRMWLNVQPQQLSMLPFSMIDHILKGHVAIKTLLALNIGEKRAFSKARDLPVLEHEVEDKLDYSLIHLKIELTDVEAERIAIQQLKGKTFDIKGRSLKVEAINVSIHQSCIKVKAQFSGAYDGFAYIKGQPILDVKKDELRVDHLELELKTSNFLMKGLSWLLRDMIKQQLEKVLRIPLQKNLELLETRFKSQLKDLELLEHVFLRGEPEALNIHSLTLVDGLIIVEVSAKGSLNLFIKMASSVQNLIVKS